MRRMADEDAFAAGGVARAFRVERSHDGDGVKRRLDARVAVHIEVRLIGLALGFQKGGRLLQEGRGEFMGTGFDGHANLQTGIHFAVIVGAGGRFHGEDFHALAVDAEFHLMRAGEAFHVFVAVAREAQLDVVFRVLREVEAGDGAAAGAEGKFVEMLFLRKVGGEDDGFAAGRAHGAADREAADFLRGGEITFEQSGREFADGDVIETVAGIVGREQRGDVDVEAEQIANRVLIFGAVQAAEGVGAAGIGLRGGGVVERRFERGDGVVVSGLVGAGKPGGRHGAGAQPADDLFPGGSVFGHALPADVT